MGKPNPMVQLMGGGALFTVAGAIYGAKIPVWAKTSGALFAMICGVLSIGLGLHAAFGGKGDAPKKYVPRRAPKVELPPEVQRRVSGSDERR